MLKTCVIIPTFNEARNIAPLVQEIRRQDLEVVVADDGSWDNTAKIARDCGAIVLESKTNQGKGASLIKGFNSVLQRDFAAVITMDGDGQHAPSDIICFLRAAESSDCGIVIGNRMRRPTEMPRIRILTNQFMSWLISQLVGQKIPDSQCGFRLIKREVLEKLNLRTHNYETESEILLQASRLGFRIESIPIQSIYRRERSYIHPLIDTLRFIKLITPQIWTTIF